jgi:alpha-mannosidase
VSRECAPVPQDGFLREWLFLGPFKGDPQALLARAFVDEARCLPRPNRAAGGRRWTKAASPQGSLDLLHLLPGWDGSNCCAYAHVYVRAPAALTGILALGSDDGVAVWLNGRPLLQLDIQRGLVADEERIGLRLEAGWNRLLVKVQQFSGAWAFCARFLTVNDVPVQGLGYALADPLRGRWQSLPALPLSLRLTPPTDAPDDRVRIGVRVQNVAGARMPPCRLSLSHADGSAAAGAPLPALRPLATACAALELSAKEWGAAFASPLRLAAAKGGRELSAAIAVAPSVAAALAAVSDRLPPGLTAAQAATVARVRRDLAAAPDLAEAHPDALPRMAALSRALIARDAAGAARHANALDRLLRREARRVARQSVLLVGHAHIDMNWLWRWPETVQVCQDTFRQAIRFMREFPEFRFTQSQAACYEAVERYDPALFELIRAAVRRGQWNVVGGMWTESDTNLSCGEALARSLLLGQRYFLSRFGVRARVGWLPDSFGHAAQMPQLLRSAGMDAFYHMRTGPRDASLYWWESPDGSRVLAKTGQGYNDKVTPAIRSQPALVPPAVGCQMFVYGVGDHGGGPTRRDIVAARSLGRSRVFPRLRFASADEYFDRVRPRARRLPVHRGELQYVFEGCYSNVASIKQGNRDLENALQSAEAAAAAALLCGAAPWPAEPLAEAWQTLVFNEFHDILPGSAIHESNDDSRARYYHAMNLAVEARARSLRAVAERVNVPGADGIPLIVFNPLAWRRSDVVEAEIVVSEPPDAVTVSDDNGREVAAQVVRAKHFDVDFHLWVQFVAADVPGLGYRTFRLRPTGSSGGLPVTHWGNPYPDLPKLPLAPASLPEGRRVRREGLTVRNRFAAVEFDAASGVIRSLRPIRGGKPGPNALGRGGANRLMIHLERPRGMSAWELDPNPKGPFDVTPSGQAHVIQEGPESVAVRAEYTWGRSRFRLTTTIHADTPRIDCHLRAEWLEAGSATADAPLLRAHFALARPAPALACDVPFAVADRPAGREVPAQKWVDVKTPAGGLALINRGKYGHSLVDGVLRLTLLRSSYDPDTHPDLGRHEITWALLPHAGGWGSARLPREGFGYNVPMLTFQARPRRGRLPPRHSFLSVEGDPAFVTTGIKQAEDSRDLVLRGYNASARTIRVAIAKPGGIRRARCVNVLEEPVAGDIAIRAGRVFLCAAPWQIVTVRLA